MSIRDVFAVKLRARRLERGLSQEELAHRADLHRTYVSAIERCKYSVSIDSLQALAKVLGVEPYELLMPEDGSAPTSCEDDSGN
ncbi:helix-turn-helix domain-containing protein [Shinella sumterensis]|uniref:helix-turn-helix domain-containing protein n=1 Tax=Shinella sumterensis TaxID=1967501 RepID=UPI003F8651F2